MPRRAPRRCGVVPCRNLVFNPAHYYCEECEKRRQRKVNAQRKRTKDYGPGWRKISQDYLRSHPYCEECLQHGYTTVAVEVDHIVAIKQGGSDHPRNLQARCKPCHGRKTAEVDGGFGNEKKVPGG